MALHFYYKHIFKAFEYSKDIYYILLLVLKLCLWDYKQLLILSRNWPFLYIKYVSNRKKFNLKNIWVILIFLALLYINLVISKSFT